MELRTFILSLKNGIARLSAGFLVLLVGAVAFADEDFSHPGYLSAVGEERYQESREVMIVPYAGREDFVLREKIFTEKLTKEFRSRYEDQFGLSTTQQIETVSNRFVEMNGSGRLVPYNEHIDKQEAFGNFMGKRLVEYHVDNYLRSGATTRKIYEAKERISNLSVSVAESYKMKMRYRLSSNTVDLQFVKPNQRFHNSLLFDMSGSGGLSDSRARFWYNYTSDLDLIAQYAIDNEVLTVASERRLTDNLKATITGERYYKDLSAEVPEQQRILFGFSWSD